MRDAIAIARRWIAGIVAGVAMLVAGGCANWPPQCREGERIEAIRTDSGPYYICKAEAST